MYKRQEREFVIQFDAQRFEHGVQILFDDVDAADEAFTVRHHRLGGRSERVQDLSVLRGESGFHLEAQHRVLQECFELSVIPLAESFDFRPDDGVVVVVGVEFRPIGGVLARVGFDYHVWGGAYHDWFGQHETVSYTHLDVYKRQARG